MTEPEAEEPGRFRGTSAGGLAVRRARSQIMALLEEAGMSNPRIFGSTARGEDTAESDVDLLVTVPKTMGLIAICHVEAQLGDIVGRPVDLIMDDGIRPDLAEAILASAVPL